jgi:thiol-disulfide isomerase/thioredoxin
MRQLFAASSVVALFAGAAAAEGPTDKPAPTLKVGDPAPVLKISKWLQGDEVKRFEPGKAYVVEFWATWCGPCIAFMPDLAEVQAQYKPQGLTCIGLSVRDPNNSVEKAAAFVKKRGPKLDYTFAFADDRSTWDAWMTAAGRSGIPCSFVVDKAGRIAYIGNPMYLRVVAPLVVGGELSAVALNDEVGKVINEWTSVSDRLNAGFRTGDHRAGLAAMNQFEAKYPCMTNNLIIVRAKLSNLPRIGEFDEAKKVAEAVMAKAIEQENPSSLAQVAALLRNGPAKENKALLAVAVTSAEAAVRLAGDQDIQALIDLAETYSAVGDKAKAKQFAHKAVQAAATEPAEVRQTIERRAAQLGD